MSQQDPQLPGFVQMARHLGITLASEDAPKLAHLIGHYVAQEREACAKVCDREATEGLDFADRRCAASLAEDIRARR